MKYDNRHMDKLSKLIKDGNNKPFRFTKPLNSTKVANSKPILFKLSKSP